jgi:L-iditol 2-dehydrogenase
MKEGIPIIIGHECCGQVVEVGAGVAHLKVGDIVAIEPQIPCRDCDFCRTGKYNLCPQVFFFGVPPKDDGALTRFLKHDASFCFKLPNGMSPEEGALLEPLSVGIMACQRAPVTLGQNVLVLGSGPIGLVTLLAAKAFGASHVCVTDMNQQRLETAKSMGADSIVLIKQGEDPEEVAGKAIAAIGASPDVSIDCVGVESTVVTGIHATKVGGILVNVGCGALKINIPLQTANTKEIDCRGIFRYRDTWPLAIKLVSEKRVDVKKLVTHRFKLEQALEAFEVAKSGVGIKVMIELD